MSFHDSTMNIYNLFTVNIIYVIYKLNIVSLLFLLQRHFLFYRNSP